jgi:hypothetical protein
VGGWRKRGRPNIKWKREVEGMMKQKNLTTEEAVNGRIQRKSN